MAELEKRTISLPAEQAAYIDEQVAGGMYESPSEVVLAGLRALQERDAAIENWLHTEVAPVYDAMQADPSRGIPLEEVEQTIRALHLERSKKA